jgi:hypothetical protein
MGMEQKVDCAPGSMPSWESLRDFLAGRGFPIQLRMIDGQIAFPDEVPPPEWRELRVGTPQGMVTIRRQGENLTFVTWGNADPPLLQAWNALVWACAHLGNGQIQSATGTLSAEEYRRTSDLPGALTV